MQARRTGSERPGLVCYDLELPRLLEQIHELRASVGARVELGVCGADVAPDHAQGDSVNVVGPIAANTSGTVFVAGCFRTVSTVSNLSRAADGASPGVAPS